jgi:C1A family cysteine protease
MEVLSRYWEELKTKANYLNVAIGTKFKDGKDTGVPAIVVYVSKKVATAELSPEDTVPREIEGVPTDIVELAPTDWQAGKTDISQLHPAEQLHRMGLIKGPISPKAVSKYVLAGTPSGASEWSAWAYPAQDQANCGICTAFGNTGVWETKLRIAAKNPNLDCKLSEAHLFFCSGGTCDGGNTVDAVLNHAMKGVCLESCLPYKDIDQACSAGICANWWLNAKRLKGWNKITDPTAIKILLDSEPLNCTMAVHQSLFNYVSGVYKNLGNSDPIVGYHDIGNLGYSDALSADLIRNSWKGWGSKCLVNGVIRPGYCWIAYGELDAERQQLILDGPVPAPSPTPIPISVLTMSLPVGYVGISYSAVLSAKGGTPPYVWSVYSGVWSVYSGLLPVGLSLSDNGVISGTPSAVSQPMIVFMVTDTLGNQSGVELTLTVKKNTPTPSPCKIGNGIAKFLNIWVKLLGRKGRYQYVNPGKDDRM